MADLAPNSKASDLALVNGAATKINTVEQARKVLNEASRILQGGYDALHERQGQVADEAWTYLNQVKAYVARVMGELPATDKPLSELLARKCAWAYISAQRATANATGELVTSSNWDFSLPTVKLPVFGSVNFGAVALAVTASVVGGYLVLRYVR